MTGLVIGVIVAVVVTGLPFGTLAILACIGGAKARRASGIDYEAAALLADDPGVGETSAKAPR